MQSRHDAYVLRGLALAVGSSIAIIGPWGPGSASAVSQVELRGPATVAGAVSAAVPVPNISQRHLEEAVTKKLVFGHQSVGKNMLKGVKLLYRAQGQAAPNVVTWTAQAPTASSGWIAEAIVGRNTQPDSKISEFEARFAAMGVSPDLALLKLCYADVTSRTDVASLFKAYRRSMARLKSAHPDTVILHATVPLKSGDTASNVKRQQYNRLIRSTYRRSLIVDVARVESTTPSGTRVTGRLNGKRYYAMHPGYTTDGGHLNEVGAQLVAAELIRVMAAN